MSKKQYQVTCIKCSAPLHRRRPFGNVHSLVADSLIRYVCGKCGSDFILTFRSNDQGSIKVEVNQEGKNFDPHCPFDRKAFVREVSSLQPTGRVFEGPINKSQTVFEQMRCLIPSCDRILQFEYIKFRA